MKISEFIANLLGTSDVEISTVENKQEETKTAEPASSTETEAKNDSAVSTVEIEKLNKRIAELESANRALLAKTPIEENKEKSIESYIIDLVGGQKGANNGNN